MPGSATHPGDDQSTEIDVEAIEGVAEFFR